MRSANLPSKMQLAFKGTDDYWSFAKRGRRPHAHGLLSYPAMMIPEMMGELLERLCIYDKNIKTVYDPFVGSGTVLTESMLRGFNFIGTDINPLAILSCRVKAGPFTATVFNSKKLHPVTGITKSDKRVRIPEFAGIDKWYTENAALALATLARAIRDVPDQALRRFHWLALAGVARTCSNSRMSTYKLHIREEKKNAISEEMIFREFAKKSQDMLEKLVFFWAELKKRGHSHQGQYTGKIYLARNDVRSRLDYAGTQVDLLVTSPPYGDNTSTIPYGQYSYLPLNWINTTDIGADIPVDLLQSPYAIDHSSLGGCKRDSEQKSQILGNLSSTYKTVLRELQEMPDDRQKRLTAFVYDMHLSINAVVPRVRPGGHFVWVVGDRRIGGSSIQLSKILTDLMEVVGCKLQAHASRKIPSKKMAIRNSVGRTMQEETILGFKRE